MTQREVEMLRKWVASAETAASDFYRHYDWKAVYGTERGHRIDTELHKVWVGLHRLREMAARRAGRGPHGR